MKIDGKIVKDGKRALIVDVTPEDVKAGAKKNATACAAAVSLMRAGVCDEARVNLRRTYLKKGNVWVRYHTPLALRLEVIAFDRGGEFEPGTYKLNPLSPSQKEGARRYRKESASAPTKADEARRVQHVTTGIRQRFTAGGKIT